MLSPAESGPAPTGDFDTANFEAACARARAIPQQSVAYAAAISRCEELLAWRIIREIAVVAAEARP